MARKEMITRTCHTKCYAFETLWKPGDVYEGEEDPGKHFSVSGEQEIPPPPPTPGDDPRSNKELKAALAAPPFNFKVPTSWPRKKYWQKLFDLENSYARDAQTNPNPEKITRIETPEKKAPEAKKFRAPCGKITKSGGGLAAHIRKCNRCKAIAETEKEKIAEAKKEIPNLEA